MSSVCVSEIHKTGNLRFFCLFVCFNHLNVCVLVGCTVRELTGDGGVPGGIS